MIAFSELVYAVNTWRERNGLPVGAGLATGHPERSGANLAAEYPAHEATSTETPELLDDVSDE